MFVSVQVSEIHRREHTNLIKDCFHSLQIEGLKTKNVTKRCAPIINYLQTQSVTIVLLLILLKYFYALFYY